MSGQQRTKILYEFSLGVPVTKYLKPDYFIPYADAKFANDTVNIEDYEDEFKGYKFTEHQITFEATLSTERREANSCRVTVFNLDDDPVNYAVKNGNNSLSAFLKAGDDANGLGTVFQGLIVKVEDNWEGETRKTTFEISDAGINLKNAYTTRAWSRGTSLREIAKDLTADLRLPVGKLCLMPEKVDVPVNYQASTKKVIDYIFSGKGYEFSVINGKVNFVKRGTKFQFETAFISRDTGLIGRVNNFVDTTAKGVVTDNEDEKIKFTCLLDATIMPEETIYVQDGVYDGAYKVKESVFRGDFESSSGLWTVDVVAAIAEGIAKA